MGSGLEGRFPSQDKGEDNTASPLSYHEILDKLCPDYMAMGLTYEQYWDGDPDMIIAFRKAFRLREKQRRDQRNTEMWMQGMYFYEALIDVSPLFRDLLKNPKAIPYLKEPYPLDKAEQEAREKRDTEKKDKETQAKFKAWVQRANRIRAEREAKAKEGENNG